MVDQISMTDSGNGAADQDRKWYVIHTYSGYENKVKTNLEHRIESMGVQDKIFQVVIPTEEEIEIKDGQRRTVQKKVYPGYVMVEMAMAAWSSQQTPSHRVCCAPRTRHHHPWPSRP